MNTKFKLIYIICLLTTLASCQNSENPDTYLRKVLNNLEGIHSATYSEDGEGWHPRDTVPFAIKRGYIKEFNNPNDSTIGATFVKLDAADTTKLMFAYNGSIRMSPDHDNKEAEIDNFSTNPHPIRPVAPPFFNYTKSIIKYILDTQDSITLTLNDLGDEYYLKLIIEEDKQVEFFGGPHYMSSPYNLESPTSIYELWIDKSTDLPYKVRREMAHDISVTACTNIELNKLSIEDFDIFNYLPENYKTYERKKRNNNRSKIDLTGKVAPDWALEDAKGNKVSLSDLKSKVVLINFTGIGCGACHAAIPFLKELKNKFDSDDLELIAIESWDETAHSIQNYINRKELNYKYLCGSKEVIEAYQTGAVAPFFFILDSKRTIQKVMKGYGGAETDREIMDAITKLL